MSGGGADNPDQLASQFPCLNERGVNAFGERQRSRVVARADDDSCVSPLCEVVETDEVEAVEGEHDAVLFRGEGED
jgi:hypothetical protein